MVTPGFRRPAEVSQNRNWLLIISLCLAAATALGAGIALFAAYMADRIV